MKLPNLSSTLKFKKRPSKICISCGEVEIFSQDPLNNLCSICKDKILKAHVESCGFCQENGTYCSEGINLLIEKERK